MSEYQAALQFELEQLYFLINYHTERKSIIWDSDKEYEDYINAALDRANEIRQELNFIQKDNNSTEL